MATPTTLNQELYDVLTEARKCRGCYPSPVCQCGIDAEDPELLMRLQDILKRMDWYEQARHQHFVQEAKKGMNTPASDDVLKAVAVTVSPEVATLAVCQEVVDRMCKISCIEKMKYVYEQRSEDPENPHGWHIHAYVETTYSPSHIKNFIAQRTYKKKKGGINCSVKCTSADLRWLDNYMMGNKHNDSKVGAVKADRILRVRLGLQELYVFERAK